MGSCWLDVCLRRLGIYELFTNVWSCDDFGTGKADPEIYAMAAKRMGKRVSEILFLDDNPGACATARLGGMKVVGVFDQSSSDYEDEIRASSDYYVKDFSEIINL